MQTIAELRDQIAAENPDISEAALNDAVQKRAIDLGIIADAAPDPPTTDEIPAGVKGRVRFPDDVRGHYIVLWAPKPKRGDGRPAYVEIACVAAQDPDHAKRIVLEADGRSPKPIDQRGDVARWLIERAGDSAILLRAVPAMHWPRDVEPTGMVRPEPVLTIR